MMNKYDGEFVKAIITKNNKMFFAKHPHELHADIALSNKIRMESVKQCGYLDEKGKFHEEYVPKCKVLILSTFSILLFQYLIYQLSIA